MLNHLILFLFVVENHEFDIFPCWIISQKNNIIALVNSYGNKYFNFITQIPIFSCNFLAPSLALFMKGNCINRCKNSFKISMVFPIGRLRYFSGIPHPHIISISCLYLNHIRILLIEF